MPAQERRGATSALGQLSASRYSAEERNGNPFGDLFSKGYPVMKRTSLRAALLGLLLLPSAASSARADSPSGPTDEQKASARLLGTDGVRLAMAGDCRNAVDKLSRAEGRSFTRPPRRSRSPNARFSSERSWPGRKILNRLFNEVLPANAPEPWVRRRNRFSPCWTRRRPGFPSFAFMSMGCLPGVGICTSRSMATRCRPSFSTTSGPRIRERITSPRRLPATRRRRRTSRSPRGSRERWC